MSIRNKIAAATIAGVMAITPATAFAQSSSSNGGDVIDSVNVVDPNEYGGKTYQVTPTDSGRNWSSSAARSHDPRPEMEEHGIPATLAHAGQLVCHMIFAKSKPTWNLEDHRPHVSDLDYILNKCNP